MKRGLFLAFGMAAVLVAGPAQAGDAAKGEKLMKKCKACHTWDKGGKNKVGPNLFNSYGRTAGTNEGFKYSKGFKKAMASIGDWDDAKLMEYLKDPTKYLKANGGGKSKMTFKLKKEKDRANVIEFLKTLK